MPSTSKTLRVQPTSVRKERPASRRASNNIEMLASLPSDTTATLAERRRRMSSRASREMRNGSFSQRSSFAAAMASANGASSSSHSPDVDEAPRTKTGRISTAKKGKPVHKCDDCGKVSRRGPRILPSSNTDRVQIYTRNEHLKYATSNPCGGGVLLFTPTLLTSFPDAISLTTAPSLCLATFQGARRSFIALTYCHDIKRKTSKHCPPAGPESLLMYLAATSTLSEWSWTTLRCLLDSLEIQAKMEILSSVLIPDERLLQVIVCLSTLLVVGQG